MFIAAAVKNTHEKVLSDKASRQVVRLRTFRPEKACSAGADPQSVHSGGLSN